MEWSHQYPGLGFYQPLDTFEMINKNWPVYPFGHGWEMALQNLGIFSDNTIFHRLDDIEGCILYVSDNPEKLKNPYSNKMHHTYHYAIWEDDLIRLDKLGYVEGLAEYYNPYIPGISEEDKKFIKECFDEMPDAFKYGIEQTTNIKISPLGRKKLIELSKKFIINEEIKNRIKPFLKLRCYDTAIREASLFIETKLKEIHKTEQYGQKLIDLHFKKLEKFNESDFGDEHYWHSLGIHITDLRSLFHFIRNEYAHNFKKIEISECLSLLNNINRNYNVLLDIENVYYSKKKI